jgi:tetratricopeptide (TPR) repeat protein
LLRDFTGLRLIWCRPTALQQYYPLSGTTFWLDYHLWGFWTLPYHVENVLLHALVALLFWRLLRRLEVPGAWLAGAIFALHPVMVESAGWITERKNVLSLVFYLGALLAYGRFMLFWKEDDKPTVVRSSTPPRRWSAYALALLLTLSALLAKTTAFSLPAVMLLISWWKRGRIRWRADVLPTLPFFALAIGLSLVTAWLEKHHLGAKGPEWAISFPERCLIAGRATWFYIGKLLWPANLCFVYPRWQLNTGSLWEWLYPVTAVSTLFVLCLARRRIGRGPAAAVFFFVGTLFPLLGFMNAYFMRYSFVCDHWAYLPSLGLIALGAALVVRAAEQLRCPAVLYGFASVVLPVFAILTWRQSGMYTDIETLWRTTIARNPNAFLAYNNLGAALSGKGQVDEAIACLQKAVQLRPDLAEAYNNLGNALLRKGQLDEAITQLRKAVQIQPENPRARNNLGNALLQVGQMDEAIQCFQKALEIQPDLAEAQNNLGVALMRIGRLEEALVWFQKALQINPDYPEAHYNLGCVLDGQGRTDGAIEHYQRSIELMPNSAQTHYRLGLALQGQRKFAAAVAEYRKVVELEPRHALAANNLAWLLATCSEESLRNGSRAVELARQADRLSGNKHPEILDTLAAAYAEAGRFSDAIQVAQDAAELAGATAQPELFRQIQGRIKLYQAGRPFHEQPPSP